MNKCNVCGKVAALVCGDCGNQFYCSDNCEDEDHDSHYELCEYESVGGRFAGFGPWRRIIRTHIQLTVAYLRIRALDLEGKASKRGTAKTAVDALIAQFESWKKQVPEADRDDLHALLMEHTVLVQDLIDTSIDAKLRRGSFRDAEEKLDEISDKLSANGRLLSTFFFDHRSSAPSFGVVARKKATVRGWYVDAWKEHLK